MIVTKFRFLEMQIKSRRVHASELGKPDLGDAPEAFDAIDMRMPSGKLISAVIDTEVPVADIHQAVIASPAVGVDDGLRSDLAPDNGLQRGFLAIWHDLGIDMAVAFVDAEHGGLAIRSPTTLALHSARAEP